MATDIYLQLDGIKGESADAQNKEAIEISSFSWGASNNAAAKPVFTKLTAHMPTSMAGPQLFNACVKGTHLKDGLITVRKAGNGTHPYLTIKLTDVIVDSYTLDDARTDDAPVESISLSYGQIEFDYTQQKADGSGGGSADAGWDLKNNKAA